ncbi:DNAJ heat shock N-terminal domain-containing protein [Musa troglodytarum]|uniref:DNAJ heat shock N-terminal domain-containing protein n=2 Tax=Musa troglodytarum TaxID=320322 RepID=A0A9E7JI35_9LILI|nr:DNAJ heat shock N-terminal domain-containing protein [Musa troglodytarum]
MAAGSPTLTAEKKRWWLSNKKVVDKYLREARVLISTQEQSNVSAAAGLLDAALSLSPRHEAALELRARSLLFLRRFREVADMLQDYIPSFKVGSGSGGDDDSSSSLGGAGDHSSVASSAPISRERVKLLSPARERSDGDRSFRCFSVSELKRRLVAGLSKSSDREGQWRYLVLGQACCHLGMMEDALVLLQIGRRLASAAFRRESVCWSDDSFASFAGEEDGTATPLPSVLETASQLLSHIKLVLRRRAAAMAALDAGLPAEAVRHFSKVLDSRRGLPGSFAAGCLIGRAAAYRATGRLADAIADCNRALALYPSCIAALRSRADLFEAVRALADCLHDLEHLKLLYDAILRDRKLPGPPWRLHSDVRYRDIPANLRALTARIQQLRGRIAGGEGNDVDYNALIGVRRGCSRKELERAHLLLTLKHKPEKAVGFVDRLEFLDDHRDLDAIRDQARMSASILYRMLQKGYSNIMVAVMDEEAAVKQRAKEAAAAAAAAAIQVAAAKTADKPKADRYAGGKECCKGPEKAAAAVFQGVFCRDMAVVGSMLSHRAIPVKYEALSC